MLFVWITLERTSSGLWEGMSEDAGGGTTDSKSPEVFIVNHILFVNHMILFDVFANFIILFNVFVNLIILFNVFCQSHCC